MPRFKQLPANSNAEKLRPTQPIYQRPGFINRALAPMKETQVNNDGAVSDDLERLYMRTQPRNNVLFRSQHLPTDRTKNHSDFIAINDSLFQGSVIDQAEIIRAFQNNPDSIREDHLRKYENDRWGRGALSHSQDMELLSDFAPPKQTEKGNWQISRRSPTPHLSQNPLGSYTIGFGKDDRGNYISYADEFGVSPKNNEGRFRIAEKLKITKPFEVYDRIYEDQNPRVRKFFKETKK